MAQTPLYFDLLWTYRTVYNVVSILWAWPTTNSQKPMQIKFEFRHKIFIREAVSIAVELLIRQSDKYLVLPGPAIHPAADVDDA